MTGAILMTCALVLHPYQGEGYNTTVIRINKQSPEACSWAAAQYNAKAGKNVCTCHKPKQWPAFIPSHAPKKD